MTPINRILNVAIGVVACAILAVVLLRAGRAAGVGAEPPAPPTLVTLGAWTGSGSATGETFTTATREWVIDWTVQATDEYERIFVASVLRAADREQVESFSTTAVGSGRWVVHAPPGQYYVRTSERGTQWALTVREVR